MTRSPLFRKIALIPLRIKRNAQRIKGIFSSCAYTDQWSVLANSFPKSGTHLLLQVLLGLPVRYYGAFLASMPTITFKERSERKHKYLIYKIVPGEVLPAHLFYSDNYKDWLNNRNVIHYFIYRDLRDVVISEAYYLTTMNRWHRLHRYFVKIPTWEDRILFSILGNESEWKTPYDYPNIGERFRRYIGWLNTEDVFSVRFEDLRGSGLMSVVERMVSFYLRRTGLRINVDRVVESSINNINPIRSHTFRSGKSGQWKEVFTNKHKDAFKSVAGQLLIELGYCDSLKW